MDKTDLCPEDLLPGPSVLLKIPLIFSGLCPIDSEVFLRLPEKFLSLS